MRKPAPYDITIYQGATFDLDVEYKDNSGTSVNMSGYTVSGTVWNRVGTAKLANFSFEWTAQASGTFKLKLPAATTSGITEQGQYDVLITQPNGDKYYLLQGSAFYDPGFTGR